MRKVAKFSALMPVGLVDVAQELGNFPYSPTGNADIDSRVIVKLLSDAFEHANNVIPGRIAPNYAANAGGLPRYLNVANTW